MPGFEITAIGFDSSADASDDRILWVWSETEEWLRGSLTATRYLDMTRLEHDDYLPPHGYDFIMPKDVQALHDRLRELDGVPRLNQMERGEDYMHETHGRVTFIASDPHDGAYLICSYWDTEEDEQAFFGCEASDLRWIKEEVPDGL